MKALSPSLLLLDCCLGLMLWLLLVAQHRVLGAQQQHHPGGGGATPDGIDRQAGVTASINCEALAAEYDVRNPSNPCPSGLYRKCDADPDNGGDDPTTSAVVVVECVVAAGDVDESAAAAAAGGDVCGGGGSLDFITDEGLCGDGDKKYGYYASEDTEERCDAIKAEYSRKFGVNCGRAYLSKCGDASVLRCTDIQPSPTSCPCDDLYLCRGDGGGEGTAEAADEAGEAADGTDGSSSASGTERKSSLLLPPLLLLLLLLLLPLLELPS